MKCNIRKILSNEKGLITLEIIAYVAIFALFASIMIPLYMDSFTIRNNSVSNNFKSIDTVIE